MIDTDSDPEVIDLPIPGNDDAMRAIEIILHELADAVIEGKQGRVDKADSAEGAGPTPRRRSSRASFRADEGRPAPAAEEPAPVPAEAAPAAPEAAPAV